MFLTVSLTIASEVRDFVASLDLISVSSQALNIRLVVTISSGSDKATPVPSHFPKRESTFCNGSCEWLAVSSRRSVQRRCESEGKQAALEGLLDFQG